MGCLDPKVDKEWVFGRLAERGIVRADVEFSGGNDEGGTERITLFHESGTEIDVPVWYCGGYGYENGSYKRLSEPANETEMLSEYLQGPVDERYGTWGGDFTAYGVVVWDVAARTVTMNVDEQSGYDHYEYNY